MQVPQPDFFTPPEKRKEWRLFIFIVVFFFPLATFLLVAAMGFSIWMFQLIMGPPGVS